MKELKLIELISHSSHGSCSLMLSIRLNYRSYSICYHFFLFGGVGGVLQSYFFFIVQLKCQGNLISSLRRNSRLCKPLRLNVMQLREHLDVSRLYWNYYIKSMCTIVFCLNLMIPSSGAEPTSLPNQEFLAVVQV